MNLLTILILVRFLPFSLINELIYFVETIDALADAINAFTGGVVLVSHDMRLISVVAEELWLCENQSVTVYRGDISSYKSELREGIFERNLIDMDQTIGSAQET